MSDLQIYAKFKSAGEKIHIVFEVLRLSTFKWQTSSRKLIAICVIWAPFAL